MLHKRAHVTDINTASSVSKSRRHKGLQFEEPLLFELAETSIEKSGVDLPSTSKQPLMIGDLKPRQKTGLPCLSEPEIVRHYTRLSQKNYGIDLGSYPLGSCTMKHNPRLNEAVARLPGFAHLHPLQPQETAQGALEVIQQLCRWLGILTGLPAVAFSPAAGAQGELCGIMIIRAALEARGEKRHRILIPESAHGTNPATAGRCGFKVETIPLNKQGRTDIATLRQAVDKDVAAIMLTNPNTCGLFENDILEIADLIHQVGGYFYCDGANFNAVVGRVSAADLGIDVMHLNLHKTFSTPHGGGGPGSGPVVMRQDLACYAPLPWLVWDGTQHRLIESNNSDKTHQAIGRLKGFQGQFTTFVRALAYMMSLGRDGLAQVSGDAVLNANYILSQLKDSFSLPYKDFCMHEVLFDDKCLKGTGVTTLDVAKALIDNGIHPMTMYFPLVVSGAMLIEPTETESKKDLDDFIAVMKEILNQARQDPVSLKQAPIHAPYRRFDETKAARQPILRWRRQ